MNFRLRPATANDQPAITTLVRSAGIFPFGLDWRRFTLAVASTGETVGCIQLRKHADGSRELASLAVQPAWRGQGVARVLIESILTTHFQSVSEPLYLTCRAGLEPFYAKFGFHQAAETELHRHYSRIVRFTRTMHSLRLMPEPIIVMARDPRAGGENP
jgi:N-acetylglutamate synthase-like GNAT family acetyltransferase